MADRKSVSEYLTCPECKGSLTVIDTSAVENPEEGISIRRRRKCTNRACGFRVTSYEEFKKLPQTNG